MTARMLALVVLSLIGLSRGLVAQEMTGSSEAGRAGRFDPAPGALIGKVGSISLYTDSQLYQGIRSYSARFQRVFVDPNDKSHVTKVIVDLSDHLGTKLGVALNACEIHEIHVSRDLIFVKPEINNVLISAVELGARAADKAARAAEVAAQVARKEALLAAERARIYELERPERERREALARERQLAEAARREAAMEAEAALEREARRERLGEEGQREAARLVAEGAMDDEMKGHIIVVLSRDFNTFYGRAASQRLYIDEKYIGGVWNGSRKRFRVPIDGANPEGKFTLRVKSIDPFQAGVTREFRARPGSEVVVTSGLEFGLLETSVIHDVAVHPVGRAKIRAHAPSGEGASIVAINDRSYQLNSGVEYLTYAWGPANQVIRLDLVQGKGPGARRHLAFVKPGKTLTIDLPGSLSTEGRRLVSSVRYLMQLRNCVAHHMGRSDDDTGVPVAAIKEDLSRIADGEVDEDVLALRGKYGEYFESIRAKSKSLFAAAAGNLIVAAIGCGLEMAFTGSAPTRLDVLGETLGAVVETACDRYNLSAELKEINDRFQADEEAVVRRLRRRLAASPEVEGSREIRDLLSPN